MYDVSICIPTYNGENTIATILDSIIRQIDDKVEIVICDDQSKDSTYEIVSSYAKKYAFIKVYRNEKNLGMDRNFIASALHATGEFIWFCGQDDYFTEGAVARLLNIFEKNPDVNFVYYNYKFMNGDFSQEVNTPPLQLREDAFFKTPEEYFKIIDHVPTFLPAVIMKRSFFYNTDYSLFWDTHYVQVGIWLKNFHYGNIYVISDADYIYCRIPDDSWKRQSGQMLFEIFSGHLEVHHTCFYDSHNIIPEKIFFQLRDKFLSKLIFTVFNCKKMGLRINQILRKRMKYLFRRNNFLIYYIYIIPVINMPLFIIKLAYFVVKLPLIRSVWKTIHRGIMRTAVK